MIPSFQNLGPTFAQAAQALANLGAALRGEETPPQPPATPPGRIEEEGLHIEP